MKPYLIQRAKFNYDPHGNGIDSILDFDYMGSAEFEFGALPQSLKRIRNKISDYRQYEFILNGKKVNVFCDSKNYTEIYNMIKGLADNKYHLKEYCDFRHFIYFALHMLKSDFWWDIENDYMFWKFNSEFNTKFEKLIKSITEMDNGN